MHKVFRTTNRQPTNAMPKDIYMVEPETTMEKEQTMLTDDGRPAMSAKEEMGAGMVDKSAMKKGM